MPGSPDSPLISSLPDVEPVTDSLDPVSAANRQIGQLLEEILLVFLGTTLLALVMLLLSQDERPLLVLVGFFSPYILLNVLAMVGARRGHARMSALLYTIIIIGMNFVVILITGMESYQLISCLNLILLNGIILGPAAAVVLSFVVALQFSVSYSLPLQHLQNEALQSSQTASTITLFTSILTTGFLVALVLRRHTGVLKQFSTALSALRTSQRKHAAAAYREHQLSKLATDMLSQESTEEVLGTMLESLCLVLPDLGVLILDPVGAVLASSQELRVMDASLDLQQTGLLELAESLDDRDRFLFKQLAPSAREDLQRLGLQGSHCSGLCFKVAKTGHHYVLIASDHPLEEGSSLRDYLEATVGIVVSALRRQSTERHLRQAQKLEVIGQLSGGIAHNFNNLLMTMTGSTELALKELGQEHPVRDKLEGVTRAADRAASLIRQMLTFSRDHPRDECLMDLRAFLLELLPMLQQYTEERIEIRLSCSPDPLWIVADTVEIEQIILNLILNARDAIEGEGAVEILLARESDQRALLSVSDDGHGIPPELMEYIFQPFFTTKDTHGTGLGLSTVYGIVQQGGGEIKVDSSSAGTQFTISWPLTDKRPEAPHPSEKPRMTLQKVEVLLVEDNELVLETTQAMLVAMGCSVRCASHGAAALEILREPWRPSLILSDLVMPVMGGEVFLRHLVAEHPSIPVILMSGYDERASLPKGTTVFLNKPFTYNELDSKIKAVL